MDLETSKPLEETQRTTAFLTNKLNVTNSLLQQKASDSRQYQLVLQELNEFPNEHEMYKSFGRIFVQQPPPVLRIQMEQERDNLNQDVNKLKTAMEDLSSEIEKNKEKDIKEAEKERASTL